MDYEDIFNDDLYENLFSEDFVLEQALIHKKDNFVNAFAVEREHVNSKAFHDKFEQLPVNKTVQQSLYLQAGRLLDYVDGQEEERLVAINARTGEFLVDNFERKGSIRGTGFTEKEYDKIRECKDSVILLHNHSLNGLPSAQDLISYLKNDKIKLSLIACHDGTIYGIYNVNPKFEEIYKERFEIEKNRTSDIGVAKRLAMSAMYRANEKLSDKHKLFDVRELKS